MTATKHKTPKDKNETVSHCTSLYWKETEETIHTMKACNNNAAIAMIQTTFVKIGFLADNADNIKTNKTNSTIANGDAPVVVLFTLAAT